MYAAGLAAQKARINLLQECDVFSEMAAGRPLREIHDELEERRKWTSNWDRVYRRQCGENGHSETGQIRL